MFHVCCIYHIFELPDNKSRKWLHTFDGTTYFKHTAPISKKNCRNSVASHDRQSFQPRYLRRNSISNCNRSLSVFSLTISKCCRERLTHLTVGESVNKYAIFVTTPKHRECIESMRRTLTISRFRFSKAKMT